MGQVLTAWWMGFDPGDSSGVRSGSRGSRAGSFLIKGNLAPLAHAVECHGSSYLIVDGDFHRLLFQ